MSYCGKRVRGGRLAAATDSRMRTEFLVTTFAMFFATAAIAQSDVSAVVKKVAPAVVVISGSAAAGNTVGSGFLVSSDGQIATSLHVVAGLRSITIEVGNGDVFDAVSVLAFDARRDLVLIKVPGYKLPTIDLGDSSTVEIGQSVLVVGSPKGLSGTVTNGIVSAIRNHPNGYTVIQTNAAVNPGNSGGPLLNSRGQAIGVVVAKLKESENLNFALPINYLRGLMDTQSAPLSLESLNAKLAAVGSDLVKPAEKSGNAASPAPSQPPMPALPVRWKSQTSGAVFEVRLEGDSLTAERVIPEPELQFGEYAKFQLQRRGDKFVGSEEFVVALVNAGSVVQRCRFQAPVEFDSVTPERISGRIGIGPGTDMSCRVDSGRYTALNWVPASLYDPVPTTLLDKLRSSGQASQQARRAACQVALQEQAVACAPNLPLGPVECGAASGKVQQYCY